MSDETTTVAVQCPDCGKLVEGSVDAAGTLTHTIIEEHPECSEMRISGALRVAYEVLRQHWSPE